MTCEQFRQLLAQLPDKIEVFKYEADKSSTPYVVWNETGINQTYSSNEADDLQITVAVEFICSPSDDSGLWDVVNLFRSAGIPFHAVCGYDEEKKVFSAEFSLILIEAFP